MNAFAYRHIGISQKQLGEMLKEIDVNSLDQLIDQTVPSHIRLKEELDLPEAMTESEYLSHLREIANMNSEFRTYIGLGYYGTLTPSVILRNIFENPGWYTQYTPYQAEISQGRMEALLNFQTVVSDLTGMPIANASLLDEGTAAAEAMSMFYAHKNKRRKDDVANKIFVDQHVFPQTLAVMEGRAEPLDIEIVTGDWQTQDWDDGFFAALVQYPNGQGLVEDYSSLSQKLTENAIDLIVAADLLSLTILRAPSEFGASAVIGNTQRFGIPIGYGGPHAAYFATKEDFKRIIPGRIIGVSIDANGDPALRMALQTREQHIKREKATSNICTAQALLAIMASMYAVYHGPAGLKKIAEDIHQKTLRLHKAISEMGLHCSHKSVFDTLHVELTAAQREQAIEESKKRKINLGLQSDGLQISLDETVTHKDLESLCSVFSAVSGKEYSLPKNVAETLPNTFNRESEYLTHPVFNSYHSETEMMRYIKSLENKDLSLLHSMIPLGSCTMKLNAASELMPLSWSNWSTIHPFVPADQAKGYAYIFEQLDKYLCEITGFTACSLQPNSGAQGELTGLLTIRAYHQDRGEGHRDVALIPSSAHGTNPASAIMAGMKVIVVACDERGNIDVADLKSKAEEHKDNLASLMVTYPSTHGVFETSINEVCEIIHQNGGLVYMDGANMNAQVGLTSPGEIDADVCHLNLHKTFAIPHGGGGPGMGPICVNDKLAPYLPGHPLVKTGGEKAVDAVAAAPWGSASILLISYGYIRMLGKEGVRQATEYAILNSNYIKAKIEADYQILYTGENDRTAHELIVDLRPFKPVGISAEDIAKRLIDYGFHAPTLSFPVPGTIMIEPTESEGKVELDRFCEALLQIKSEIDEVARGEADAENNVLTNAPHTIEIMMDDKWKFPYSREKAVFPLDYLRREHKFWAPVGRVNNAYGDRNLICTCPPIESYMEE